MESVFKRVLECVTNISPKIMQFYGPQMFCCWFSPLKLKTETYISEVNWPAKVLFGISLVWLFWFHDLYHQLQLYFCLLLLETWMFHNTKCRFLPWWVTNWIMGITYVVQYLAFDSMRIYWVSGIAMLRTIRLALLWTLFVYAYVNYACPQYCCFFSFIEASLVLFLLSHYRL